MNRTHKSKIFREVNKDKAEDGPDLETDNNNTGNNMMNLHKIGDEESLIRDGKNKKDSDNLQETKNEDGVFVANGE